MVASNNSNMTSSHGAGNDRVKKASYYVWFLGACECRGLRGSDVVSAVIGKLLGREKDHEPEKVTLQVSSKGIKLLQLQDGCGVNSSLGSFGSGGGFGNGGSKHLLPAAAITYVQQESPPDDDLVTAVLLIYNPATRCPVHVHAYRCDSPDTASILSDHLMQLLQKPQQQAKLAALEARLAGRGLLGRGRQSDPNTGGGFSGPSSGGSAANSGGSSGSNGMLGITTNNNNSGANLAALYDSLAAELREKLGGGGSNPNLASASAGVAQPLLSPARDYHHQHSHHHNHQHSHHHNQHTRQMDQDDSARSSGIGSDDAPPSPTNLDAPTHGQHNSRHSLHRQLSSSGESNF